MSLGLSVFDPNKKCEDTLRSGSLPSSTAYLLSCVLYLCVCLCLHTQYVPVHSHVCVSVVHKPPVFVTTAVKSQQIAGNDITLVAYSSVGLHPEGLVPPGTDIQQQGGFAHRFYIKYPILIPICELIDFFLFHIFT